MERWDFANPERSILPNLMRAAAPRPSRDACPTLLRPRQCNAGEPTREGRTVKNFASPSFFRTFDLLMSITNPGSKLTHWTHDGVEWVRERTSIAGRTHSFVIEVITLTRAGRRGWCLMVTKEHWWAGEATEAIRSGRWARPLAGRRKDIIEWFHKHELEIDRGLQPASRRAASPRTLVPSS